MATYFFHLHNEHDVLLDEEGIDLPDLVAIRDHALTEARAIIAADVAEGTINLGLSIEVRDSAGAVVLQLPFSEAVTIVPPL